MSSAKSSRLTAVDQKVLDAFDLKECDSIRRCFLAEVCWRRVEMVHEKEKGYNLSRDEKEFLRSQSASRAFGEVLPNGVRVMFNGMHLNVASARTVYDLGSGCGKLCLQAFLEFPHLDTVVGVELSPTRAGIGFDACRRLAENEQTRFTLTEAEDRSWLRITERVFPRKASTKEQVLLARAAKLERKSAANNKSKTRKRAKGKSDRKPRSAHNADARKTVSRQQQRRERDALRDGRNEPRVRTLELREGNLFDHAAEAAKHADIVVLETNFHNPSVLKPLLDSLQPHTRVMLYNSLDQIDDNHHQWEHEWCPLLVCPHQSANRSAGFKCHCVASSWATSGYSFTFLLGKKTHAFASGCAHKHCADANARNAAATAAARKDKEQPRKGARLTCSGDDVRELASLSVADALELVA